MKKGFKKAMSDYNDNVRYSIENDEVIRKLTNDLGILIDKKKRQSKRKLRLMEILAIIPISVLTILFKWNIFEMGIILGIIYTSLEVSSSKIIEKLLQKKDMEINKYQDLIEEHVNKKRMCNDLSTKLVEERKKAYLKVSIQKEKVDDIKKRIDEIVITYAKPIFNKTCNIEEKNNLKKVRTS